MNNIYDVGIIGLGVSGALASYKLVRDNKNLKVVAFDIGRKWLKRRRQIEAFLGCFPNSDGKLYHSNLESVASLIGSKKVKTTHKEFMDIMSNVGEFVTVVDKGPSKTILKKANKYDYEVIKSDYVQVYPKDVHALSRFLAKTLEDSNIDFHFDEEVFKVYKRDSVFVMNTEMGDYQCKKLIIAAGRSGWRWARNIFSDFGIVESDNVAKFGIRVEMNSEILKEFNQTSCTLVKNKEVEVGPFCWCGTVIPEDHIDTAISAFRSNENRWKTDKVFFNIIGNRIFPNKGFEQTDRLAKLTFVITNDRIVKERTSSILTGKSKISVMPEYNWLKETILELSNIIPDIITKSYFHVPTIIPLAPQINIGNNLSTEIEGLFVVGESAGNVGILSAACMGLAVAEEVI